MLARSSKRASLQGNDAPVVFNFRQPETTFPMYPTYVKETKIELQRMDTVEFKFFLFDPSDANDCTMRLWPNGSGFSFTSPTLPSFFMAHPEKYHDSASEDPKYAVLNETIRDHHKYNVQDLKSNPSRRLKTTEYEFPNGIQCTTVPFVPGGNGPAADLKGKLRFTDSIKKPLKEGLTMDGKHLVLKTIPCFVWFRLAVVDSVKGDAEKDDGVDYLTDACKHLDID